METCKVNREVLLHFGPKSWLHFALCIICIVRVFNLKDPARWCEIEDVREYTFTPQGKKITHLESIDWHVLQHCRRYSTSSQWRHFQIPTLVALRLIFHIYCSSWRRMVTFYPSVRESSVCLRSLVHLIQIVRKAATCAMVLILPQSQRQTMRKHSSKVMYQGFNRLNVSPKAIPQNQAQALQEHLLPCPPHALERVYRV